MTSPKLTVIPDILEEHLEELAFLWHQRSRALHSPLYTMAAFRRLENRIEAHLDGLVNSGEEATPLLKEGLMAEDGSVAVFANAAAAYALLRLDLPQSVQIVIEAFRDAEGNQLEGIRQALCHAAIDSVSHELMTLSHAPSASVAIAAIEALVVHSQLRPKADHLEPFLFDGAPYVRQVAWRVIRHTGHIPKRSACEWAFADEYPAVRQNALWAAACTRQEFLLDHCRSAIRNPIAANWEAALLLGIVGTPDDLPRVLAIIKCQELGQKRFQLAGSFGHPETLDPLICAMEGSDLRAAVAAGAAFRKITGCDVESKRRVHLPPDDGREPDKFEQEFLDEVKLPDSEIARNHWTKVKQNLSPFTRVSHGIGLEPETEGEIFDQLDMESRWEAHLRQRFKNGHGDTADLGGKPGDLPCNET